MVASHFNDSSSTLPIDQKVFTKNPTQHCTFHSQSSHQLSTQHLKTDQYQFEQKSNSAMIQFNVKLFQHLSTQQCCQVNKFPAQQ